MSAPWREPPPEEWLSEEDAHTIAELVELHGFNQPTNPKTKSKLPSYGHMVWGAPAAFFHIVRADGNGSYGGPITSWDRWYQLKAREEARTGQPSLF